MINKTFTMRLTFAFFIIISVVSCSPKYMPVYPGPKTIQLKLVKGDRVKVVTKDQREFELTVSEIGSDFIIGNSEKVHFSDISSLELMIKDSGEATADLLGQILVSIIIGGLSVAGGLGAQPF